MDELKLLVDMVAGLPTLAVWVLVAFLFYKLAVVGSVYGLIRFGIEKTHSFLTAPRTKRPLTEDELRESFHGICITHDGTDVALMEQIRRVRGKALGVHSPYIHSQSVDWLREAIDDRITRDSQKKSA